MTLKDRRRARGWTQEDLSARSGVSVRTIQRLETGSTAGADSLTSLAAAFDVDVETLLTQAAQALAPYNSASNELRHALSAHLVAAAIALPALTLLYLLVTPGTGWIGYVYAGWGSGLALHVALSLWAYPPARA